MNRNERKILDPQYSRQQKIINDVCKELNLIAYRPNYHAKDRDCNTVMVYTPEDHKENLRLEKAGETRTEIYKYPVFTFENTDVNGMFDLNFANRGKIDLRTMKEYEVIENAIKNAVNK
jgi:hypothetical protein